jgi:hypothetical protein
MRIQIESTTEIVTVNGVEARMWEGATESGVPVIVWIPRIAVRDDQDTRQFEAELQECRVPSAEVESFPLRMIL